LALAPPGSTVKVEEVLFGAVEKHCRDLGVRSGTVMTCGGSSSNGILVSFPTGMDVEIPRDLAWFVTVVAL